jgi:hypothetical protein
MNMLVTIDPFKTLNHGTTEYTYTSQRVSVTGHETIGLPYDSREYPSMLEARLAALLIFNVVQFTPSPTITSLYQGEESIHEPDFFLSEPIWLNGFRDMSYHVLETKGVIREHSLEKQWAFEETWNLSYLLVSDMWVTYWEASGLFLQSPVRLLIK